MEISHKNYASLDLFYSSLLYCIADGYPVQETSCAVAELYICCLSWWSWYKFLLPISVLVANSTQLVGSPDSRWVTLVRDVNFNRLVYHTSTLYAFTCFQSTATDSTLSDYCYNPIMVSPLIDFKTKVVWNSWLLHLVLLSAEIKPLRTVFCSVHSSGHYHTEGDESIRGGSQKKTQTTPRNPEESLEQAMLD